MTDSQRHSACLVIGLSAAIVWASLLSGCGPAETPTVAARRPALPPDKASLSLDELQPLVAKPINPPEVKELPDEIRPEVARAEKLIAERKFNQAISHLNRAAKSQPTHTRILRNLGLAYAHLGKRTRAVGYLVEAAKTAPDDLVLQVTLGRLYSADQKDDQAILAFRTAIKCSQAAPENPLLAEALLRMGKLLSKGGYSAAALECYTELSKHLEQHEQQYVRRAILGNLVRRPERLQAWRGELLLKLRRPAAAARVLERSFRYDRTHLKTARLLIEALLATKDFAKAESLLAEIAAEKAQRSQMPALAESLCNASGEKTMPRRIAQALRAHRQLDGRLAVTLAKIAASLDALPEATAILQSFLETMPGNAEAGRFLASLYARQGRQEKALRLLADLLTEDPAAAGAVRDGIAEVLDGPTPVDIERSFALAISRLKIEKPSKLASLRYVAGQLAQARGDEHFAAEQYRKALDEDPKFLPAYEALIELYIASNQQDRLKRILQQAAEAAPDGHLPHYLKGKVHLARGQLLQAATELKQARAIDGRHLPTLLLLGRTAIDLSDPYEAIATLGQALKLAPNNEQIYRMLFEAYIEQRRFKQAGEVIRRLLRRKPASPTGKIMLAEFALQAGRPDAARKALDELRKLSPDHAELVILTVRVELAGRKGPLPTEDFQQMAEKLSELIRRDPKATGPRKTLAELFARQGEQAKSEAADIWGELFEQTGRQRDIAKAYVAALLQIKNHEQAAKVLKHLIAANPGNLDWRRVLVPTLIKLNKPDRAAKQCLVAQKLLDERIASAADARQIERLRAEKLRLYALVKFYDELVDFGRDWSAQAPENTTLKRLLVSLLAEAKRFDQAHMLLDEWIAAGGEDLTTYRRMKVLLYLRADRLDEAVDFAIKWVEAKPALIEPRRIVVGMLVENEKLDQAQELLDKWLAAATTSRPATQATQPIAPPTTQPTAPSAVANWSREQSARLLVMRGKHDEALKRLAQYAALDPKNEQLLVLKSVCLSELDRPKEAVLAMEAAQRLRPDDPGLKNNLGYMYADLGIRLDKAERIIRQALAEMPNNLAFRDSLAWTFYKKGKFDEAGRIFEQILSTGIDDQSDQAVILDHAGDVMWRLGRKDKAVKLWKQAVDSAEKQKIKPADISKLLSNVPKKIEAAEANSPPPIAPLGRGLEEPPGTKSN